MITNLSKENKLDSGINIFKNYIYNEKNKKSCETLMY